MDKQITGNLAVARGKNAHWLLERNTQMEVLVLDHSVLK